MIRRWCVYLAVLGAGLGLYQVLPGWATWIAVLTAAGSPLVSVAISAISGERDTLGLFRLPKKRPPAEYDQKLRAFHPGDRLSRVHWKRTAKTGAMTVREEGTVEIALPSRRFPGILPVVLCFGILVCLFPPGRNQWQLHALPGLFQRTQVRLDLTAGPREESKQAVLDVVASKGQLLYLRGQTFEKYDGQSWQSAELPEQWQPQGAVGTVRVATRQGQEYTFSQQTAGEKPRNCLQLPKKTRVWAEAVLDESGDTVAQIQNLVRSCAKYDENVEAMAAGADFARWFLEESGRGYCVHFATAAAVLLRAAGIPARLATGYAVTVQAGVRKTVTGRDAHAWVEYWDGSAWRILEVTPTVEAAALPAPAKKENRRLGGFWMLILLLPAALVLRWRRKPKNGRLKELRQKAVFSRDGLNDEEKEEYKRLAGETLAVALKGPL